MARRLGTAFVFLLLLCAAALSEQDGRVFALLQQGDAAEARMDTQAALSSFVSADSLDPNDPAILLRIAKQYCDLLLAEKDPEEAQKLGETALGYAKRALALDPSNAKTHLCVAVCYGRLTDFAGTKTKIEYARLIKEETEKSLAIDPTDDYAYHVLGRWNYSVANLNPIVKWVAKLSYGGLPDASNEEAEKDYKKAEEIAPQRIIHHNELARVYVALGKEDLARKEWQAVLDLPVASKEDEEAKKTAKEALDH